MSDARVPVVRVLLAAYVRGDKTDAEIRDEVRADPALAPLAGSCLGCSGLAQELLEALGLSPFDDLPDRELPPVPTREGLLRWLERVRDGREEPTAMCDWATDALAWHDPGRPIDPLVHDLLAEIAGGEDDVLELVHDGDRLELVRWHLERTAPERAALAVAGLAVHRRRDEILVELLRRASGETDDQGFRGAVRRSVGDAGDLPDDVLGGLVAAAVRVGEEGLDLALAERLVDRVARGDRPDLDPA